MRSRGEATRGRAKPFKERFSLLYTWVYTKCILGYTRVYTRCILMLYTRVRTTPGELGDKKATTRSRATGRTAIAGVCCMLYGAHCIWCKLYGELSLVVYATGRAQASPQQPPKVTAVVVIREQLGGTGAAWAYSGVRERERAQRAFERTGCRYPRMKTHFNVQLHLRGLEILFLEIIPEY